MSSFLPNTSFYYDVSTAPEMDTFLKRIYTIAKDNPELYISPAIIYNELKNNNLKRSEVNEYGQGINVRPYFDRFRMKYSGRNDLLAFCDEVNFPGYFQFIKAFKDDPKEFIKLYIPLDLEHLYDGVNEIIDYLVSNNVEFEAELSGKMRTDNFCIRLKVDEFEKANRLIDYISINSKTKDGLNENNPFLPSRKGVAIITDRGNSYNYDLSKYISTYIANCKLNRSEDVSLEEFRNYLRDFCYNMNVLDNFELAYEGHSKVNTEEGIVSGTLNEAQKYMLFLDTLKETYRKHGASQAKLAISKALDEDSYDYFSRGDTKNRLRENLKNTVNSEDMLKLLTDRLQLFMDPEEISVSNEGIASQFCDILFSDELVMILDSACDATLEKYDRGQLEYALDKYLTTGASDGFARFANNDRSVNYRRMMRRIDNKTLLDIISKSLRIKGVDTREVDIKDLISRYVTNLIDSNYKVVSSEEVRTR